MGIKTHPLIDTKEAPAGFYSVPAPVFGLPTLNLCSVCDYRVFCKIPLPKKCAAAYRKDRTEVVFKRIVTKQEVE